MPKETFLNLNTVKKKQITDAFLREFAVKPYDEASLTGVVKQLGIAKGSVYQYFNDKLDVFMYLLGECSSLKMKYVQTIVREDYDDFWSYFRDLYVHGVQFDSENALHSHFLHNLIQNLNSPSVKKMYDQLIQQSVGAFEAMVTYEVDQGFFRNDIDVKTMGFMLYKVGVSIQEHLDYHGIISPKESIAQNQSVYLNKKDALLSTVDEYIKLIKPAFQKQ